METHRHGDTGMETHRHGDTSINTGTQTWRHIDAGIYKYGDISFLTQVLIQPLCILDIS